MLKPTAPSRLPASLARRLQAIPERVVLCRDVDRLYAEARRRAAEHRLAIQHGEEDSVASEHLASCARCQRLYSVLESALLEPPQPLPQHLLPSLVGLSQQPSWSPPRWLRDVRYAAAACLLFAFSLTFVVEESAATLRVAKDSMGATTTVLAESFRSREGARDDVRSRRRWEIFFEKAYLGARYGVSRLEASAREFTNETLREFQVQGRMLSHQYRSHLEGEPHGE